ncbi:hypothetical protein CA54_16690 [Symmachiella macrocystis]|uniref:Uncharacterized protein n=1 Tax=Symmachiella macrocystis TaxID=2527985 RepID=A0A5C6BL18_9PLAN|nr:hypothetical protein [Symmachiella macrocystis]TWU12843.1 hypothetical protein CA54_16690 [Symmachiella macrocystis]
MASVVYLEFKRAMAEAEIDFPNDTFHLVAVMTDTTVDTENNGMDFVGDFTDLDEFDGANYERKTLSGVAVAKDAANGRLEIDWADVTYTALGVGTRGIAGFLLMKFVTNDAASIPVAFIEKPGTPDGNDFLVQWHATDKVLYF